MVGTGITEVVGTDVGILVLAIITTEVTLGTVIYKWYGNVDGNLEVWI